jgi:hypothetical protein
VERHSISIWFFIGSLLSVYGVLILGTGVAEWVHPQPTTVVLSDLHLAIWWGAGMLVLGLVYAVRFRPRRGRDV